jgi:hypothetical protein
LITLGKLAAGFGSSGFDVTISGIFGVTLAAAAGGAYYWGGGVGLTSFGLAGSYSVSTLTLMTGVSGIGPSNTFCLISFLVDSEILFSLTPK